MGSIAFYLQWCLDHLNYWTITLLMAIESSFIPFPSEVVVTPAAYKAAEGELNVVLVVVFATIGANIGALFNYYLAYFVAGLSSTALQPAAGDACVCWTWTR